MSLIFGDNVKRTVHHLIGTAFAQHTPEAMQKAIHRLEGIRLLLAYTDTNNTTELVALGNEIMRCHKAIDLMEAGKL